MSSPFASAMFVVLPLDLTRPSTQSLPRMRLKLHPIDTFQKADKLVKVSHFLPCFTHFVRLHRCFLTWTNQRFVAYYLSEHVTDDYCCVTAKALQTNVKTDACIGWPPKIYCTFTTDPLHRPLIKIIHQISTYIHVDLHKKFLYFPFLKLTCN